MFLKFISCLVLSFLFCKLYDLMKGSTFVHYVKLNKAYANSKKKLKYNPKLTAKELLKLYYANRTTLSFIAYKFTTLYR